MVFPMLLLYLHVHGFFSGAGEVREHVITTAHSHLLINLWSWRRQPTGQTMSRHVRDLLQLLCDLPNSADSGPVSPYSHDLGSVVSGIVPESAESG